MIKIFVLPLPAEIKKRVTSLLDLAGFNYEVIDSLHSVNTENKIETNFSKKNFPNLSLKSNFFSKIWKFQTWKHTSHNLLTPKKLNSVSLSDASFTKILWIGSSTNKPKYLPPNNSYCSLPGLDSKDWFSVSVQADFLLKIDSFVHHKIGKLAVFTSIYPEYSTLWGILLARAQYQTNPHKAGLLILPNQVQKSDNHNLTTDYSSKPFANNKFKDLTRASSLLERFQAPPVTQIFSADETHFLANNLHNLIVPDVHCGWRILSEAQSLPIVTWKNLLPTLLRAFDQLILINFPWPEIISTLDSKKSIPSTEHGISNCSLKALPQVRVLSPFEQKISGNYLPSRHRLNYLLNSGIIPTIGLTRRQTKWLCQLFQIATVT